jgi:hypothetical protein
MSDHVLPGWLFGYIKQHGRRQLRSRRRRLRRQRSSAARTETLERRLLMSTAVTLAGNTGSDAFYIRRNGANVEFFQNVAPTGTPTHIVAASDLSGVTVQGQAGDDSLTIDFSGGNPIPAGITFDGGDQDTPHGDNLAIIGIAPANYTLSSSHILIVNGALNDDITYSSVDSFNLVPGGGGNSAIDVQSGAFAIDGDLGGQANAVVDLTVESGADVSFPVAEHFNNLNLESGSTMEMLPAGGQALVVNTFSGTGMLDLANNDMIVRQPPDNTAVAAVQYAVAAGFGKTVTVPHAVIMCSTATADGHRQCLSNRTFGLSNYG